MTDHFTNNLMDDFKSVADGMVGTPSQPSQSVQQPSVSDEQLKSQLDPDDVKALMDHYGKINVESWMRGEGSL